MVRGKAPPGEIMKTRSNAGPRQKAGPKTPAKAIDPSVAENRDEDSTGGDDADDRNLPNLRNDEVDATAQKRDNEERFSIEQRREDDKKSEENKRDRRA
jgi:hypothetical protein